MDKYKQEPTKNIKIGHADYYLAIQNIYLAVMPRPNWFRRMILRIAGVKFIENKEVERRMRNENTK